MTEVSDDVGAIEEEDEEDVDNKGVVVVAAVLFDQLFDVSLIGIFSSRCALSELTL